jgi:copper chaperone CopZ
MKHLMIMSLSILVLMIGTNHAIAQDENSNDKYSYTMLEVSMDCNACEEKVKTQLAYTKGVKEVKTDHVKNQVAVKYLNKKCSEKDLIASLAEIDYEAKVKSKDAAKTSKSTPCSSQQKKACGGSKAPCSSKKSE